MSALADILIAGAGPTGLTAALELARRRARVRIIEQKEGPSPLSKAVGISAHSLEILESSGAAARLLEEGLRLRGVELRNDAGRLGALNFSSVRHRYDFLLALPQSRTEAILAERLARYGVEVEWGARLTALTPGEAGVDARIEGPDGAEATRFACVFGADGVRSLTRRSAGIDFLGIDHERTWSIADAELDGWPHAPDAAQLFLRPGGDVSFVVPIGPGRFRLVSNTPDALGCTPGGFRVRSLIRTDQFHISSRLAERFQDGLVFLGGDAAHCHSPVGARGMNLGIEDAACFAERWNGGGLAGYTQERRPAALRWIRQSEAILRAAQADRPAARTVRNLAVRLASRVPLAQRAILSRVAGLGG